MNLVIIPCGAKKANGPRLAADLYTGSHFRAGLRAAKALRPNLILILSAKHGLVMPEQLLAPYNLKMGQPGSVTPDRVRAQADALELLDADVIALTPRAYSKLVAAVWPQATFPLEGCTGMGYQRQALACITKTGHVSKKPPRKAPI